MEIKRVKSSVVAFSVEKNAFVFKLNVVSNFEKVLEFLKKYDNNNLLEKLVPCMVKEKLYEDVDMREMPSFSQEDTILTNQKISIKYDDVKIIEDLIVYLGNPKAIKTSPKCMSCWFPKRNENLYTLSRMKCITHTRVVPKYPIYIISLGRWEKRLTSKYLEGCGIDYKIVVEPDEYENYAKVINPEKIIKAPENFSKLGQGGIPVRNFVWEHSIKEGHKKHWILDDNIKCYYRKNQNQNTKIYTGDVFKVVEDYTDRYENVKMSGHQYLQYVPETQDQPPITYNTRVFSSILLSNDMYPEFAWRGKYNEDIDLAIRLQKKGYVNVLFNFINADKETCLTNKGGNTSTIYNVEDAMLKKAEALKELHPDIVEVVKHRTRGWHHKVDFSKINNELKLKEGIELKDEVDERGWSYVETNYGTWFKWELLM